jgi:pimeloyl-ACP methyl ester carboxylesterase
LYGVVCREFVPHTSRAAVTAAAYQAFPEIPAALAALVPNLGVPFDECSTWDVPPIDESELIDVPTDVPTLLLSGSFDTQTPPADAARIATTMTNGIHEVIPGAGHVVSLGNPCAHTLIFSFLDRLNEVDDSCLATATVPQFTVAT